MAYVPNATDVAQPTDAGVLAATAASEFRTIKTYLRDILLAGINLRAPLASPTFTGTVTAPAFSGPTTGAHNGTVGATTPAAGSFTALNASGNTNIGYGGGTSADLRVDTTSLAATVTVGRLSATGSDNTKFNVANRVGVNILAVDTAAQSVSVIGALSAQVSGMTQPVKLGQVSDGVTFGTVSLNGAMGSTTLQGLMGGSPDGNLYINTPAGGSINLRIGGNTGTTLDAAGNLLVGVASGAYHKIYKNVPIQNDILSVGSSATGMFSMLVTAIDQAGYNAAISTVKIGREGITGRSINAGGTISASGADYAEYERNNGITFIKGSIVGFKADGTLTDVYADAVRFAVKSTNPSYVGGDTWGSEDQVGKRPDEPQFVPAPYTGSQAPTELTPLELLQDDAPAIQAIYDAAVYTHKMNTLQYAASVEVAKNLFDTATYPEYVRAKAVFETVLEAARIQVDRVAYAGKVPCNVLGATPGGYVIAVNNAGAISGEFIADPDFAQYKKAVGRVNKILLDGRCEIAVIIH